METIECVQPLSSPHWIMQICGLWPVKTLTKSIVIKLTLNLLVYIFVISVVIHNIINAITLQNIALFNWMACIALPIVNYYAKIITLLKNKNVFFSILEDLQSAIFNMHNEKFNEHIRRIDRISKMLAKYFAVAVAVFILIFSVLPFMTDVIMAIPPSFNSGKYDILYKVGHLCFTIYFGTNFVAYDILYISLMALCIAQLNILIDRLTNVCDDAEERHSHETLKSMECLLEDVIRECIMLHEAINRFVKKLEALLSLPFFVQYLVGCFIICNTILQLTILGERSSTNTIGLCCYSAVVSAQMTAYHWLGNEITFKSNKIIESCYLSKWYELNLKSQKSIILLMERAERPLTVTIYKLIFVSLTSLGVIVRWSYSVFAIIKARYN